MGYNLEKLRFVFEILAFRSKMRKHFVLRIITTPDGLPGARSEFDTFSDFISLFNIKINTKEGNMVSLYHKFVPYLKWDYSRFDDHLYLEEYPNVPIPNFRNTII